MTTKRQQLQLVLADAQTFVVSQQVNRAFATLTPEHLIQEAIARNGTSGLADQTKFDPYSVDFFQGEPASGAPPASLRPVSNGNFVSGTDVRLPTKIDSIRAIAAQLDSVIEAVKASELNELSDEVEELSDDRDSIYVGEEG